MAQKCYFLVKWRVVFLYYLLDCCDLESVIADNNQVLAVVENVNVADLGLNDSIVF